MRKLRGNLTYANVISTLALFLAISGGAAYAASLGKNSVGTKQLKNGAVTEAKIRKRSRDRTEGQPRDAWQRAQRDSRRKRNQC